jgi:hypothetical protein
MALFDNLIGAQLVIKIPQLLQYPKVHYRVHNIKSLDPILSQLNRIHILIYYFFKIRFNIILPSTSISPNSLFPSGFPTEVLYAFIVFFHKPTCYNPSTSHSLLFGNPNISWTVQIMKLLVTQWDRKTEKFSSSTHWYFQYKYRIWRV